jgi:hypothetical protein
VLGLALLALGRVEQASASFARAGTVSDQVGDHAGRALATYGDALLAVREGDDVRARPLFAEARRAFERLGVWLATGLALAGVAGCDARAGALDRARGEYADLLRLASTTGEVGLLCLALEGSAGTIVDEDPREAAALLGRAGGLRRRYGRPASDAEEAAVAVTAAAARRALGDTEYDLAAADGAARGLGS